MPSDARSSLGALGERAFRGRRPPWDLRAPRFERLRSRFARVALALVLATSGCGETDPETATAVPLAPADLTVLLPLGGQATWKASGAGGHGPVLPRAVFDLAEALTRVDEPDALFEAMQVVGVRLDPCFVEGRAGAPCASQVRLVLQPVFDGAEGRTARDAALHLFYAVPRDELTVLAKALQTTRLAVEGSPEVGLAADPSAVIEATASHVGAARLTRMTFMAVHASDEAWSFGGFDLGADGSSQVIVIPGVAEAEQHLTSTGAAATLDATILPHPTIETALPDWLAALTRPGLGEVERAAAAASLARLLDPEAHNPGTVDCASCHIATTSARFLERERGEPLAASPYDDTRNQRMFGWFGSQASVSPRVLGETAAALRLMNEALEP